MTIMSILTMLVKNYFFWRLFIYEEVSFVFSIVFFIPSLALAHSDPVNLKGELIKQKTTEIAVETISGGEINKTTDIQLPQLEVTDIQLESQSSFTTQTNDNPNNAQYIQMDTVYSDYLTEQIQTRWYVFEASEAGKLTAYMQTVASTFVDYDLHLFKLNESTMTLEDQVYSTYGPSMNEQVATLTTGGIYFIAIDSWNGYDNTNPFAFIVTHSPSFDNNEPDDNIWQATIYSTTFNHFGTIDNEFDQDWIILSLINSKIYILD